jgi:hypothetical protein
MLPSFVQIYNIYPPFKPLILHQQYKMLRTKKGTTHPNMPSRIRKGSKCCSTMTWLNNYSISLACSFFDLSFAKIKSMSHSSKYPEDIDRDGLSRQVND